MKLLFLFTLITFSFASRNKKALEIHFFNMGNADSQLIVFPSGYNILIDVGDHDVTNAIPTKTVAKRIEEILGHKNLDVFVLSHFHSDHAGAIGKNGIWYLLETAGFTIKKFIKRNAGYFSGDKFADCKRDTIVWKYAGEMYEEMEKCVCYTSSSKDKTKLSAVAENAHRCSKTQINPPDEGARVSILMRDALGIKSEDSGNPVARVSIDDDSAASENDFSICIRINYQNFTYATCGDLNGNTVDGSIKCHNVETYIAPMMGEVDLMKANHHGSYTSNNEVWCNTLKPTVSIVTCGNNLPVPNVDPMNRLKNVGSTIYTVSNECDKGYINQVGGIIEMGEEIIVTVPKGNSTFTVANLSGTNVKEFKIKQNKPDPEPCKLLEGDYD